MITRRDVYSRLYAAAAEGKLASAGDDMFQQKKRGASIHMLAPTLVASARKVYDAIKRDVEGEIRARLAAGEDWATISIRHSHFI